MSRTLIAFCLFAALASAQNLPDAPRVQPQPAAKCGPWSCWHPKDLPNIQVLKSRAWWLPSFYGLLGTALDNEVTKAGEGQTYRVSKGGPPYPQHYCVEKNINPPFPSRGQLYKATLPWQGAITGLGFLFTKAGVKWPIYAGMQGAVLGIHLNDSLQWFDNCWS